MTPTREQLASIEWVMRDSRDLKVYCPVCLAHRDYDTGHAPDCWLAACLAAPPPAPQAMPPIEIGDWVNLATEYRTDVMRIRPGDLQFGDWVAVRCGDRVIAGIVTGIGGRSSPHKYSGGYDWWAGCIPTIFGINYEEQCNDWGPSPTPVARDISDIVEVRRAPVAPVEPRP